MYVDEAGFDSYLYRPYARAPRGEKIHEKVKGRKYQRTSIVAGQTGHDIIAHKIYVFLSVLTILQVLRNKILPKTVRKLTGKLKTNTRNGTTVKAGSEHQ